MALESTADTAQDIIDAMVLRGVVFQTIGGVSQEAQTKAFLEDIVGRLQTSMDDELHSVCELIDAGTGASSGTPTVVPFGTARVTDADVYTAGGSTFIQVERDGLYLIEARVTWTCSNDTECRMRLLVNGSPADAGEAFTFSAIGSLGFGANVQASLFAALELTTGDQISIDENISGGPATLYNAGCQLRVQTFT